MRRTQQAGRGHDRAAVVWEALRAVLDERRADRDEPLRVVDVGGGTGGLALRIAEAGDHVTVVDPSPDALAALERRAAEAGVQDRLVGVAGDAVGLVDQLGAGHADVVVCHGVLEVVERPDEALAAFRDVLRPGGALSVVVAGRYAAVLGRALAGELDRARHLLDVDHVTWDLRADGPRRFTREEVEELVVAAGLDVARTDAVRVFSDLVPSGLVDGAHGGRDALADLERAVAGVEAFGAVASQHHVLATRR
ncbi:methyltransferase [Solicola sp. PLA-1-18]|uniref:methyltransferase n=1 Tax=Solicola sp. PLA-1-18 TaxID=3380532 RepID=UPI003B81BCB4